MGLGAKIFRNALYGAILGIVVTVAICAYVIIKGGSLSQNGVFWGGVWIATFGGGCGIGSTKPSPEDKRMSWVLVTIGTVMGILGTLGVAFLAPIPRKDVGGPIFLSACMGFLAFYITWIQQFKKKGNIDGENKK